jgi:hypothetical protein
MMPLLPLIRDLTQPLYSELPNGETRRDSERDQSDGTVSSLVQPLHRGFDPFGYAIDDDE